MTLSQSTINIIQTIVQIFGLSSIVLLAFQIRSSTKWNRRTNSQNKINQKHLSDKYNKLADANINTKSKTLEKNDLEIIFKKGNQELMNICEEILNYLEEFSVSFNMKMIDRKYAYHAYSADIIKAYDLFKPLIEYFQNQDELYYSELKNCYDSLKKVDDLEKIKSRINNLFKKQKT
jgi:hypothetical protein